VKTQLCDARESGTARETEEGKMHEVNDTPIPVEERLGRHHEWLADRAEVVLGEVAVASPARSSSSRATPTTGG
jgi:hypothetical protein